MAGSRNTHGYGRLLIVCLLLPVWTTAALPQADDTPDSTVTSQPVDLPASEVQPGDIASSETDSLTAAENTAPEIDLWKTGISPTRAVLMSPVFPGWGQLYAGNNWRASVAFGVEVFYLCNMFAKERKARRVRDFASTQESDAFAYEFYHNSAEELWEQMRDYGWWAGGAMLILALDAYIGAHLFEFDTDPVPVPDRWDEYFGSETQALSGSVGSPTITVFRWHLSF